MKFGVKRSVLILGILFEASLLYSMDCAKISEELKEKPIECLSTIIFGLVIDTSTSQGILLKQCYDGNLKEMGEEEGFADFSQVKIRLSYIDMENGQLGVFSLDEKREEHTPRGIYVAGILDRRLKPLYLKILKEYANKGEAKGIFALKFFNYLYTQEANWKDSLKEEMIFTAAEEKALKSLNSDLTSDKMAQIATELLIKNRLIAREFMIKYGLLKLIEIKKEKQNSKPVLIINEQ
jgi:hypothetical protein